MIQQKYRYHILIFSKDRTIDIDISKDSTTNIDIIN